MNAQAAIASFGWVEATGPADADVLLICGSPGPDLQELIDAVWEQIPSPRYRVRVDTEQSLDEAFHTIRVALQDETLQHADARTRRLRLDDNRGPLPADTPTGHTETSDDAGAGSDTSPSESSSMADTDMAMDMSSDGDMGMGMDMGMDMDMSGPAGIPLAGGGEDRDGLEMDVTHLSLGPLLPGWPADLVLHCTLHGDVIADARAERLLGTGHSEQLPECAVLLDDAARLLTVAGWEPAAHELAGLRNSLLKSANTHATSRLRRVTAQVRRSRTLRWSLKNITTVGGTTVLDRLLEWLDTALAILSNPAAAPWGHRSGSVPAPTPADIRLAVLGQEIAATRLIVAALGTQSTYVIPGGAHE
ncbi:hypothetical protein B7R22_06805 [Subtercola boreus]|uniref:Uncharacterized protein n=1 Tax=Subtercola boreus TaxID=120213 RepID=A0A3E0W0M1_9MICO|nr:hypothetical protein [Subtercola boreus]RFA15530.1 hypothetical protein B7R22_06805 [Subtercola boreus]